MGPEKNARDEGEKEDRERGKDSCDLESTNSVLFCFCTTAMNVNLVVGLGLFSLSNVIVAAI